MNEIDRVLLEGVVGFGRGCFLLWDWCFDGRNFDNFYLWEREIYCVVVFDGVIVFCLLSSFGKFKFRLFMWNIFIDNWFKGLLWFFKWW